MIGPLILKIFLSNIFILVPIILAGIIIPIFAPSLVNPSDRLEKYKLDKKGYLVNCILKPMGTFVFGGCSIALLIIAVINLLSKLYGTSLPPFLLLIGITILVVPKVFRRK